MIPWTGVNSTRYYANIANEMSDPHDSAALLTEHFGAGPEPAFISVPGRVNLIGEHVDYHGLPVLPMAIQRCVRISFRPRDDHRIRAVSLGYGEREFEWKSKLEPSASGDWENYIKAAAQTVHDRWNVRRGIDAAVISDLPPAAGLSSSSALLTGFSLALLQANRVRTTFGELMEVLPEGEYFVGTRGGGMDHAAVLASKAGSALLIHFVPVSACPVPIPKDWAFLVAHSLTTAEKSGAVRAEYNLRRTAGTQALQRLGFSSYAAAIEGRTFDELETIAGERLEGDEQRCFLHVAGEALRTTAAVTALRAADASTFGRLLNESHASLRDLLRVSNGALDELVDTARDAGALGARLTGAGFGGCAVVFCHSSERQRVAEILMRRYYSKRPGFDPSTHLIAVEPSAGAFDV
jgi:galactokinase